MTTTKPPVLTDEEIYKLIQPHPKEIGIVGVARAIEQAVLERAGADAVRDAALEEAVRELEKRRALLRGQYESLSITEADAMYGLCIDAIRALKVTPAAAALPKCLTCGDRGEIGGFVSMDSGYQSDPCPDCTPAAAAECEAPPLGWCCTRAAGHDGPCAAVEAPEDVEFVERGMDRLRKAGYFDDKAPAAAVADAQPSDADIINVCNTVYTADHQDEPCGYEIAIARAILARFGKAGQLSGNAGEVEHEHAEFYRWIRVNFETMMQWSRDGVWYPYDGKVPGRLDNAIRAAIAASKGAKP